MRTLRHFLIAGIVIASTSARADEPAAPWPDFPSLWGEPDAESSVPPDAVLFLPPIVLDGATLPRAVAARPPGVAVQSGGVATPYVAAGPRPPAVSFPDGVLGGPQMILNPDAGARVTVIPQLGTAPNFGTTLRGAGVSVQGGSSNLGVGIGVSRDEAGRTTGGLGITLTFP